MPVLQRWRSRVDLLIGRSRVVLSWLGVWLEKWIYSGSRKRGRKKIKQMRWKRSLFGSLAKSIVYKTPGQR